jgi:hypothetical protein
MLAEMTPAKVRSAIEGFPEKYMQDWKAWLIEVAQGSDAAKAAEFRRILKGWQAVRGQTKGRTVRHTRTVGGHEPPFTDDLLERARPFLATLTGFSVRSVASATDAQRAALDGLWTGFKDLPTVGQARCVGITKAVMLITLGRVGPALDSAVRNKLGIREPEDADDWIEALKRVAADLEVFERRHVVRIEDLVEEQWKPIEVGRVYDMVFGPRDLRRLQSRAAEA